jgi:hypothetical protein
VTSGVDRITPPLTRGGRPIGDPAGRMTAEVAAEVVERLAAMAGLTGAWSGHSLRHGFANAARAAGHDPLDIARAAKPTAPASSPDTWTPSTA